MIDDEPLPLPEPARGRPSVTVTLAEIILGLIGFPATFVGLTLAWGVLTAGDLGRDWVVPVAFTAYGLATLVAFIAHRRRSRWALPAALLSQLPWIAGMWWAFVTIIPDWSFLVAAGLGVAAAAASVLVHLSRARRG